MSKKKKPKKTPGENLRLDPDKRLAPLFDSTSIALFPVAEPEEMGFRVLDNVTEENIQ